MAITDDLRKTLTDPTPFYFAAGTADLAMQQARKVPGLLEQMRAEAPARMEAVRNADPKAVQEKVVEQAREAQANVQAKVTEVFGSFDADLRKLGESAQDLALRSLGMAAEYAVRARETYEKVAEHGEETVRAWRGEAAEEITDIAIAVEPEPATKPRPRTEQRQARNGSKPGPRTTPGAAARPATPSREAAPKPEARTVPKPEARTAPKPEARTAPKPAVKPAAAGSGPAAAKKTAPRKTTPRKTTPPSSNSDR